MWLPDSISRWASAASLKWKCFVDHRPHFPLLHERPYGGLERRGNGTLLFDAPRPQDGSTYRQTPAQHFHQIDLRLRAVKDGDLE